MPFRRRCRKRIFETRVHPQRNEPLTTPVEPHHEMARPKGRVHDPGPVIGSHITVAEGQVQLQDPWLGWEELHPVWDSEAAWPLPPSEDCLDHHSFEEPEGHYCDYFSATDLLDCFT